MWPEHVLEDFLDPVCRNDVGGAQVDDDAVELHADVYGGLVRQHAAFNPSPSFPWRF